MRESITLNLAKSKRKQVKVYRMKQEIFMPRIDAVILVILMLFGCSNNVPVDPLIDKGWIEVSCDECYGKGFVVYCPEHEFVRLELATSGEKYTCSICGGSGKLFVQPSAGGSIERSSRH